MAMTMYSSPRVAKPIRVKVVRRELAFIWSPFLRQNKD
jgi:hypothetical protein